MRVDVVRPGYGQVVSLLLQGVAGDVGNGQAQDGERQQNAVHLVEKGKGKEVKTGVLSENRVG